MDRPKAKGQTERRANRPCITTRPGTRSRIEQIELPLEVRGEAPIGERSGEATSTAQGIERSGLDETLMERIVERGNLRRALKRVRRNQGSPGVDGLTVDELPA